MSINPHSSHVREAHQESSLPLNSNSSALSVKVSLVALAVISALGGMIAASVGDVETAGFLFSVSFSSCFFVVLSSLDIDKCAPSRTWARSYPQRPVYIFPEQRPIIITDPLPVIIHEPRKVIIRGPLRETSSLDGERHAVKGVDRQPFYDTPSNPVRHRPFPSDLPLDKDDHASVGK